MRNQLAKTIHSWLVLMDIKINVNYLEHRLMSHPDYPSVLSVTSLLNELGIENAAAQMEIDQLQEITDPFLAFVDDSDFVLIDDIKRVNNQCENFNSRWSGVVVMAEKPKQIIETKDILQFKSEHSALVLKKSLVFFLFSVLMVMTILTSSSITDTTFFLLSLAGFVISGAIVLHELGIDTPVFSKLCAADAQGQSGCDAVGNSKASTLMPGIKLSDIGLSFFSGNLVLLIFKAIGPGNLTETIQLFIAWATAASIPFVVFSLYYQWKIVKRWCITCLMVVACLVCMQAIQFAHGTFRAFTDLYSVSIISLLFTFPGFTWLLVRQVLDKKKELSKSALRLLQIYRSTEVFQAYLKKQKVIDMTPWATDFQLGNSNAPCQILMVSAPYCGPCAEAHKILQQIVDKHRGKVGITIRFLMNVYDPKNLNTDVQEHMLRYAFSVAGFFQDPSKVERMLHDWYQIRDLTGFQKLYPVDDRMNVWNYLEDHSAWVKNADIHFTPEFYINGYKLQNPYKPSDLIEFAGDLSELFAEEEIVQQEYSE